MARPAREDSGYRVSIHSNGGYRYASTQPSVVDPQTGVRGFRRIHWGTLDKDMKFHPGTNYLLASIEERGRLVFPKDWDLSEIGRLPSQRGKGRPVCDGDDASRFYGDIWLLWKVAEKTGIMEDLKKTFDGNLELVNDIFTLAVFPYVTGYTYNRVARWQRLEWNPSVHELDPPFITRLTQSITEQHRMDFLRLRAARLGKDELLSVDSTTRSAYGNRLADERWGRSKDHLMLKQTTEVVAYTVTSHMPVFYKTYPGNIPDSRSLKPILTDLEHAGFKDSILVTDRGYESLRNLEAYILGRIPMIMCTKVQQSLVLRRIEALGSFDTRPEGFSIDPEERIYWRQYDESYDVSGRGGKTVRSEKLKVNLYFDPVRRSGEMMQLEIDIQAQREALDKALAEDAVLDDDQTLRKVYCYHKVTCDPETRRIVSYVADDSKVARARRCSGFFSITTHRLDKTAMEVFHHYSLRDEQEKYFQQMKGQMVSSRQRNWPEEGKTGRLFILFVGLILSSQVRHIWKTTDLKKDFSSSLEVLDEMRSIRCVEHKGKAKYITPFIGGQLEISNAFGFEVPEGCAPKYASRKVEPRRRGRPSKKQVTTD